MEEREKFPPSLHLPKFLLRKGLYENKLVSNKNCYFLFPVVLLFLRTVLMKSISSDCKVPVMYFLIIL